MFYNSIALRSGKDPSPAAEGKESMRSSGHDCLEPAFSFRLVRSKGGESCRLHITMCRS